MKKKLSLFITLLVSMFIFSTSASAVVIQNDGRTITLDKDTMYDLGVHGGVSKCVSSNESLFTAEVYGTSNCKITSKTGVTGNATLKVTWHYASDKETTNISVSVVNASEDGELDNPEIVFDLEQICETKENPELVASFRLVGIFLNIIKIIVPIIIIVMGMFDMSKAVLEGKDDSVKKQLVSLFKRFIACILIFFAPRILLGIFHFVDGWDAVKSKYAVCVDCVMGDSSCPEVGFGGQSVPSVKSDDDLVEETKKRARDSKDNKKKKDNSDGPMEVLE